MAPQTRFNVPQRPLTGAAVPRRESLLDARAAPAPFASGRDQAVERPVVTPAGVLAWRERLAPGSILPVPTRAILALDSGALGRLRRRRGFREQRGPAGRFWAVRGRSDESGPTGLLAVTGVGGPVVAVAIEELVALGAREVISIGLAGGLGGASSGDVVVLDGALPRDGTSGAYGSTDRRLAPDESLRAEVVARLEHAGLSHLSGPSWTTDAVYRETPARLGEAINAGAVAVEMEAAAVLAVSRALGARAAAIVVIADRIVDGQWLPPDDLARCRRAEAGVIDALLDR